MKYMLQKDILSFLYRTLINHNFNIYFALYRNSVSFFPNCACSIMVGITYTLLHASSNSNMLQQSDCAKMVLHVEFLRREILFC